MTPSHTLRRAALLLCCWATLANASDTPADYTHAIALTVSGKNAVVQLRLPQAVYLNARSADLRDLRVFDSAGKALPFALMEPAAQAQASRRELPVTVFPVLHQGGQPGARNDVNIKTSNDGAVISISTQPGVKEQGGAARLDALVLDLGKANGAQPASIDALAFTLPPAMTNYHAQVELEVSSDLRSWQSLGFANLSWLSNSGGSTLASNRMEFAAQPFRYARLSWRDGEPVEFARIVAESSALTDVAPALESVVIAPGAGRFAGDALYRAALAIPVRRINLQFGQQNTVLPALLGSYTELPAARGATSTRWEFRPRMQATFFQLSQNGKLRSSGDVIVDNVHESSWVLRPASGSTSASAEAVQASLKLSWVPDTLVFLASGAAPYSLRFGREPGKTQSAQRSIAQVAPGFSAAELAAAEQAVAGPASVVAVQATSDSDARVAGTQARTRMLWLWAVLLLGVAVLGSMAWKLFAQMKTDPPQ